MSKEHPKTPEEFFGKYTVSVDHDGVIADTRNFVVNKVNKEFGTTYEVSDINDWHWVTNVALEHGWDLLSAKELDKKFWYDPELLLQVPPTDGAVDFMKWFYDRDMENFVITSREPRLRKSTLAWYAKHMPFVKESQIIIGSESDPRGDYFKVWAIQSAIKPAIHIEDSPDHARKIIEYTETVVALMSSVRTLDNYGKSQLIRLLDSISQPISLNGVREKIVNHAIFAECRTMLTLLFR